MGLCLQKPQLEQRFLVNAALTSTPLSSPLDSPDILNTIVPLSELGATTTSLASIKISSMDSINVKNQQNHNSNASHQIEQLIDEKCRILNKTGTPKGSALHLANWMKGQLDKQQEQARLAAESQQIDDGQNDDESLPDVTDDDERITFWTREQLEKRTKELNLAKENGNILGGKKIGGVDEVGASDADDDMKSASRSTTSDSQITVRSSPIANLTDKLSVCRHCHKNCKQKLSPSPPLLSNSLKVQHSQASPNRCCQFNSLTSPAGIASSGASSNTDDYKPKDKREGTSKSNADVICAEAASSRSTSGLLNGNCSGSESDSTCTIATTTKSATTSITTITTSTNRKTIKEQQKNAFCNCKCNPEDFSNTTLSPDEIKQETCKIIEDVSKISNTKDMMDMHKNCKCVCKSKTQKGLKDPETDDDWSLVLIGLAQFSPAAKLVNSDAFVPTISVVPPTPDAVLSKTSTNIWDNTTTTATATKMNVPRQAIIENIPEDSPDESPQDEEPPYRALNTSLRRYGTLSSLEKFPSDEINESEDGEEEEEDGEEQEGEEEDDDDIEVITREVFSNHNNQASLRNWTARAGSYVAEKMSFFEESRAFIDKYLGRWSQEQDDEDDRGDEEEQLDECTSGATSGEEVWGTPTSGGDNDDMQMMNSDHTQSSPTRSSSSLNGDDDTELMMDELLMAPPMTASTIRGLLPRRRLEPLFEEETESDEEKTQLDGDIVKKGETSANGHDLKDSIGNLKDEMIMARETTHPSIKNDITQETIVVSRTAMMTTSMTTIAQPITLPPTTSASTSPNINSNISVSSTTNIVRRAKFTPPPPPPRRLLLTQSELKIVQPQQEQSTKTLEQEKVNVKFGPTADDYSAVGVLGRRKLIVTSTHSPTNNPKVSAIIKNSAENIVPADNGQSNQNNRTIGSQINITPSTSSPISTSTSTTSTTTSTPSQSPSQKAAGPGSGLSPRLEMRLALNHDILGDEDLISYDPGPDLTTILGHDLSTFHRLTGRDLLNRSANRIQPKEAVISYSQQRNSKMDTPTLNRKRQQQQQQSRSIWNNSAYADQIGGNDINVESFKNNNNNSEGNKLSDLELLAKREKIYCTSQLKSGSPARTITPMGTPMTMRSTSSTESVMKSRKLGRDECGTATAKRDETKTSRFFNFLTRRNSENQLTKGNSKDSLESSNTTNPTDRRVFSPRKDNDKPPLNRRFWKQITKRRRAHSVSEIAAS